MSQIAIYITSFLGLAALLTAFGFVIYKRHRQLVKDRQARLQMVEERMQQVTALNLPPFYIDHVRDPIIPHDQELDLSTANAILPRVPSLVRAGADRHVAATAGQNGRTLQTLQSVPSVHQEIVYINARSLGGMGVDHVREVHVLAGPRHVIVPIDLQAASTQWPQDQAQDQEPDHLHHHEDVVAPPPSYDVPNRVTERSPIMGSLPAGRFGEETFSSHRDSLSPTPSERPDQAADAHQPSETPRYSAEFPSHIPHEQHLDHYRRSRALSNVSERPTLISGVSL